MKTKLFAATVVALIPLAALAGEGTKTPDPATSSGQSGSFDTLDANKDGRISMPEASADPKLVESFSTADKNGDGYLDASEYNNSANTRTEPQQQ
jgi:Ca2+-binding EF-hand superfamily protein